MPSDPDLISVYLRSMSQNDAKKVAKLHEEQHGVAGMTDVFHVGMVLLRGKGKLLEKKKPTIILQAFTDFHSNMH